MKTTVKVVAILAVMIKIATIINDNNNNEDKTIEIMAITISSTIVIAVLLISILTDSGYGDSSKSVMTMIMQ